MERTIRDQFRTAMAVFKHAARKHAADLGNRMAAAIAYRTVFAIAPMLVVGVSIAGFVVGGSAPVHAQIVLAIRDLAGPELATRLNDILIKALEAADTAAVVGVLLLLWASSTLFLELQRDLNEIFEIRLPTEKRWMVVLAQRGIGFLWTVGIGIILIALFAVNTAAQVAGDALASWLNTSPEFLGFLGFLVSFAFMALMFGVVFQTLTIAKIPWRPVWIGALFTATVFTAAGYLTGVYFNLIGEPSALGVAGSIVLLLFLAYLLSSVFLLGAQVAHSYWRLVYGPDQDHLLFLDDDPRTESDEPGPMALSMTAVATFLVGLLVGSRNRNR